MKRILIFVLAALLALSLCACGGRGSDIVVQDGMKLAGHDAGNEAVSFNFTYPEEWDLVRNDGVIELQTDCDDSDTTAQYATITVLTFSLVESNKTAKEYWAEHEAEVKGIYSDYKLLDTEEYNDTDKYLDDAPALKVKYQGAINGKSYVNEQIICMRYGELYLITLVTPADFADKTKDTMAAIKANFKFVK
jgi:hypothetical protein